MKFEESLMKKNVEMVGMERDIEEREEKGKKIRIGIIGEGEMGKDIVKKVERMKGIEVGEI